MQMQEGGLHHEGPARARRQGQLQLMRGGWRDGLSYGGLGLPLAFVALPLYVVLPNYYARAFGVPLATLGAVLLGGADLLARWLIAPQELPVGVLTAVLGGGYLLWLMHRRPL